MSAPQKTTTNEIQKRAIGCLFGQAVGDALGTRYEFSSRKEATADVKDDMWNHHLPILGGGPFKVLLGQVTDDTELALGLARSLVLKTNFDIHHIAHTYTFWKQSPPFDIGQTTTKALSLTSFKNNTPEENYQQILKNSQKHNQSSLSNGCLMRISPLGIAGVSWDVENLISAGQMDCALTNPNPVALDAVGVYLTAIQTAILTGDPVKTFTNAYNHAKTDAIRKILDHAVDKAEPVILDNGKHAYTDGEFQGFLGVALQNCFYELIHSQSFEESLVNIVKRGGDTDTNGCICGALLGAIYGYDKIPPDWRQAVTKAKTIKRQKEYPFVKTDDLMELALLLLDTIEEPHFHDDFESHTESSSESEDSDDDIYGPNHTQLQSSQTPQQKQSSQTTQRKQKGQSTQQKQKRQSTQRGQKKDK